jgi:uncharacterized membrane protein
MPLADALLTWIHLISASVWVGGTIFIGVVLAPMLKNLANSMEERILLMVKIGRRFNMVAIPSLAVLIATGIYKAREFIISPDIFASTYGTILIVKIFVVISMIAVFGLHVRIYGRDIEQKLISNNSSSASICKLRTKIIWFGRIIVGQSVIILLLASMLDSGV